MRIVWSRRALGNMVLLRAFIARDSEVGAAKVATRILASVELLATQPAMGRPGRRLGTRELVIPGTPYIVPYRVKGETIGLIAVLHGKQRWPEKL
jgi:toxin ParE1/3/4